MRLMLSSRFLLLYIYQHSYLTFFTRDQSYKDAAHGVTKATGPGPASRGPSVDSGVNKKHVTDEGAVH